MASGHGTGTRPLARPPLRRFREIQDNKLLFGDKLGKFLVLACLFAGMTFTAVPSVAQQAPSGDSANDDPETGEPYRDRLIDPDVRPDPRPEDLEAERPGLPWVAGASYRFGRRDSDGSGRTEHALTGSYQRDTANWGRFQLDVLVRDSDSDGSFGEDGTDGHFTATQTGLPLGGGWLADNGLGVQRSVSDPMIESSYRVYLPASIVNGVTTRIGDGRSEWRFTWGEIGRVEGLYSRTFESEDAALVGGGYSRELDDHWRVAAEFWRTDPEDESTRRNLTAALAFEDPDAGRSHEFHAVADDDGDTGFWYDGVRRLARWSHYFGAFSLDEALTWQNAAIVNDRRGAYYRAERRGLRADYNLGLDAARSPSSGDADYRLFAGVRWRLDSRRSVGTQLGLGGLEPGSSRDRPDDREAVEDWQASVFFNHGNEVLEQRIELRTARVDDAAGESLRHRLSLDQFWNADALEGLATRVEWERQDDPDRTLDRLVAGFTFRHRFPGGVAFDAGLLAVRQDVSESESATGGNATLNFQWPFHEDWSLGVNATYTRSAGRDPLVPEEVTTMDGNQVFVTLSWGDSGGRLPGVQGRGSAERGIGRITGYVFFDRNRDGRRSPGEEGVEGAVVRLDGVVTAVTDARGRYEFWPVAAGAHRLGVSAESLPLPWEPDQPTTLDIQPRSEAFADLPVTRISE